MPDRTRLCVAAFAVVAVVVVLGLFVQQLLTATYGGP